MDSLIGKLANALNMSDSQAIRKQAQELIDEYCETRRLYHPSIEMLRICEETDASDMSVEEIVNTLLTVHATIMHLDVAHEVHDAIKEYNGQVDDDHWRVAFDPDIVTVTRNGEKIVEMANINTLTLAARLAAKGYFILIVDQYTACIVRNGVQYPLPTTYKELIKLLNAHFRS